MNYLIPPINTVGKFKLKPPLDNLLNDKIEYKVISIRSIKEMLEDNIDVYKDIYEKLGLDKTYYDQDLANDGSIVTLLSPEMEYIYIPSSFFLSIPDVTGVIFRKTFIVADLGLIPEDADIDYLIKDISDLITNAYGVLPTMSKKQLESKVLISYDDYDKFEKDRITRVNLKTTCRSMLQMMTYQLLEMKKKIAVLVKKITDCENINS